MSDHGDKLTLADVQALTARANSPSPGPASAAQNTLQEAVVLGDTAFVDQIAYEVARRAVENFLNG